MPGERERSDDPLAITATAPGAAKSDASPPGDSIGRYRLEREIGAGGMGVVHAAFDPDLERRVALKVLRTTEAGGEARQRLLREARALARLTHPNVVTVHEVGSASGRDFVAMELIDGETLADWLRGAPHDAEEILAAFIAAGRGLAAAHAAGLVHRDFKPHNVLRRKDGRIVVTDFGLARGVEVAIELEATLRLRGGKPDENTPSPLTGLTQTGSVLGTPAYMAPEQWSGGPIGPPADQFAFCVALWEALSGERPYRGTTLEALKEEVHRGPADLDDSKLPRRVRAPLRRGLDPDPNKRWPSINALLAAVGRGQRKPRTIALAVATGTVIASAIGFVIATDEESVAACDPPALDPSAAWSPAIANEVRLRTSPEIASAFEAQLAQWQAARRVACAAPKTRRLTCLDGVLVRFDAVRKAALIEAPGAKATLDDINRQLIDPAVCARDDQPRLPTKLSDLAVEGLALAHQREPGAKVDVDAVLARAKDDVCARALVLLARAEREEGAPARDAAEESAQAADTCGDDRTRADALLGALAADISAFMPKVPKSLAAAESAVRKVAEPELLAKLDLHKASIAEMGGQFDDQLRLATSAIEAYGDAQPRARFAAALTKLRALSNRGGQGDLEAARKEAARWRQEAERASVPRVVTAFDILDTQMQWELGDVEGAHARHAALQKRIEAERTKPLPPGETISGTVVDAAGKPVANATVIAELAIIADSVSIGALISESGDQRATTDAAGRFTIEHVTPGSIIVAQLGNQRSRVRKAKTGDKLVLGPTTRLTGRVVGRTPDQKFVFAISGDKDASPMYQLAAPLARDGTFTLEGAPIGKLRVGAVSRSGLFGQSFAMQDITVGPAGATNVDVRQPAGRKLRVVVRSAAAVPLAGAQVFIGKGTLSIKTLRQINQLLQTAGGVAVEQARTLTGETPPELKLLPGDLVATFTSAPTGAVTACGLGLTGDTSDPAYFEIFQKHRDEIEVRCVPVAPDASFVVVEVPPMKRFD